MSLPAIEISGLSKRYVIEHESRHDTLRDTLHHAARKLWRRARWGTGFEREDFWALKDVSFSVQPGEVVGIIGRNGAGKSTLLKILSRITEPTAGKITLRGRVASLLEVGTGFHPDLTGRENIFLNGAILGMSRAEIRKKFDEIVAFAEVEKFLDTPVKRYSSGMYVRLAFAVAAHLEPEILIVDEVLAVGDAQFQKKCLGKMQEVARGGGRTVLFVSHNSAAVAQLCSRGLLLSEGRAIFFGPTGECLSRYAADRMTSDARAVDTMTVEDPRIALRSVSLNGETKQEVAMSGDRTELAIEVVVHLEERLHVCVEAHLRDQFGAVIGFFSPGHSIPGLMETPLEAGAHCFRASVRLPKLNRGLYSLDLALTRPGLAYFARGREVFRIEHEGSVTPTGVVFQQSAQGAGSILLEGDFSVNAAG